MNLPPEIKSAEELQLLAKELRTLADGWRNSSSDPHNIAHAVMVSLLEVSNAITRVCGKQSQRDLAIWNAAIERAAEVAEKDWSSAGSRIKQAILNFKQKE